MPARPRHLLLWGAVAALIAFAIDQATKAAALAAALVLVDGVELLPFFNLVLVQNRGVSFGLLATDHTLGRWLLILITASVTGGLVVWLMRARSRAQAPALGLVIGGALGNLVDRLRHGAVTDFLDLHARGYHWPAFNLADSAIVVGALLLLALELCAPVDRATGEPPEQLPSGKRREMDPPRRRGRDDDPHSAR